MSQSSSLVEVARRARVSISTVSRTITNTGRISEKTRARIRRLMAEMGYKPNRVARRLRAEGKCHLLGLIIPSIQNPFFADLARGVEDVAYRHSFAVLLCNYDEDPAKQQFYLDVMEAESVDGIILPPAHEHDAAVLKVMQAGIPVVCVDRTLASGAVDKVEVDNERGAFDAVAHLLGKGHRRIGLIGGPADSSTGRERLLGYRRAHAEAGVPIDRKLVRLGDYREASGRRLANELIELSERPTALFVCNSLMMIGAIEAITAKGLHIPRQMALIGFDDLPLAAVFTPPLSVVRQPAYEVGRAAAELLVQRIENPSRPATVAKLRTELVLRSST
jgi:LacI family transcriptional regulator/LacI family repressor for deo operon, udp, cdd, tsx, nupC, and nupG